MIIKEVNSDTYGLYYQELIGVVSFKKIIDRIGIDEYIKWTEKFHPVKYFVSFSYIPVDKDDNFSDILIFVAREKDNKKWKDPKGVLKKFPISMTDKKIERWYKSLPENLLFPSFLLEAKDVNEVLEKLKS